MTVPLPARLLIATTNPGKLDEIRGILGAVPVTLVTLADHSPGPEPEETGSTFAENARLKARYYAGATGELTVAEDSGLEIDALDGEPGVHSARFNGESYAEKFATIQEMLAERGTDSSTARFVCALTLAVRGARPTAFDRRCIPPDGGAPQADTAGIFPRRALSGRRTSGLCATRDVHHGLPARTDGIVWETTGIVEGRVRLPPRGNGGFGYDPIFYYPAYGRTLAEVTAEEKAAVSHRGQAFRALGAYFGKWLDGSGPSSPPWAL